jgi:hypothetical protein
MSKWTWMVCGENSINADCGRMEGEGWEVVSIVLTNPGDTRNGNWYRVFMRRLASSPDTKEP